MSSPISSQAARVSQYLPAGSLPCPPTLCPQDRCAKLCSRCSLHSALCYFVSFVITVAQHQATSPRFSRHTQCCPSLLLLSHHACFNSRSQCSLSFCLSIIRSTGFQFADTCHPSSNLSDPVQMRPPLVSATLPPTRWQPQCRYERGSDRAAVCRRDVCIRPKCHP